MQTMSEIWNIVADGGRVILVAKSGEFIDEQTWTVTPELAGHYRDAATENAVFWQRVADAFEDGNGLP